MRNAARDISSTSGSEIEGSHSVQISELGADSPEGPPMEEPDESEKSISSRLRKPFLRLLSGKNRKLYCSTRAALHKAAIEGDMKEAKRLMGKDHSSILCAAITEGHQTLLHVAAGAKQASFVEELVKMMNPEDLMLQDKNGNTAFCLAAAVGAERIAKIMLEKNPNLVSMRGGKNMTPLYLAALFGQKDMASFLFNTTKFHLLAADRRVIFFTAIDTGLYDLALALLKEDGPLALTRHVKHGTALHMLGRNPSAFACGNKGLIKRIINSSLGTECNTELVSTQALELVKCLWTEIIQQDVDVAEVIRKPTNLLFDAAEVGNFKFLAELIGSYPDLVHELDENGRSIFHIAILYRHVNIFNLINGQGFNKELLTTYVDHYGHNILHLAAKYPTASPFSTVSGAAIQMQRELQIFKKVEMMVHSSYRESKNSDGKTPRELFTMEHLELLKSGEKWMKSRASSCIFVAALIAVMAFVAAFIVPLALGNDKKGEILIHLTETWFQVFSVSDALALSCSVISIAIFLSILISRFAEEDFFKLLPLKLLLGLSALIISILSMLVAFSSSFLLAYDSGLNWVVMLSTVLVVVVAMAVIVVLHCPFLKDIFCSTYRCKF